MSLPALRKGIDKLSPYTAGKGIEEIRKKYNLEEALKLASNENLWGTSEAARLAIERELDKINIYPDPGAKTLTEALAEKHSVNPENIINGNGTDEIIELAAKAFLDRGDSVVTASGSFVRYKMAAMLMGCNCAEAPRKDHRISVDALCAEMDSSTKLIFIDNPSNPQGTYITGEEIEKIINNIKNTGINALLVIDEAYYEYAESEPGYKSALNYLNSGIPIMVLRTFSKAYGLAGLRIGYGISSPEIISALGRVKPPFNTNRLAQAAATAALTDTAFIRKTVEETKKEKEFLYAEFKKLGFESVPSAANFILTKVGEEYAEEICAFLEKKGIIVRPLAGYYYPGYLRFTIGTRPHNVKLLKAVKDYFASGKQ